MLNAGLRASSLTVVATIMVLSGGAAATATVAEGNELVGTPAPAWTVTTWINSQPLSLEQLRGKVVLLRWWTAPGCPFCEASAPHLRPPSARGTIDTATRGWWSSASITTNRQRPCRGRTSCG